MQGINSIGANQYLGLNGYNMDSLATNPYFLAALNSPNYNQMQANAPIMNNQALQQQPQADTFTPSGQNNVSFEGKGDSESKDKKGNRTAWAILGIGLTAGLAILGHKAYKLGPEGADFFKRLGKGASAMWDDMCCTGKNLKGKLTNSGKNKTQFSVSNINGNEVYTLPNQRVQRFALPKGEKVFSAEQIQQLSNLGINVNDIPSLANTNLQVRKFWGNVNIGDANYKINYSNGKIRTLIDAQGNDILSKVISPTNESDKALAKSINEYIEKVLNKDLDAMKPLKVELVERTDDVIRKFIQEENVVGLTANNVLTNRYSANSNEVLQYLGKNKNASDAIEAFKKGDRSKLKVATATFKDNNNVTYYIKDGKIESINIPAGVLENTEAGTYKIGTPAFDAYAYKNKEFMPKILERQKDWTDVVYHLA